MGLEDYAIDSGQDSVFEYMTLPDDVDGSTVRISIMLECAELELLYPDLDFLRNAVGAWSAKELPTWERLSRAAAAEYDPIENYNRIENAVDSENKRRDSTRRDTINSKSTGSAVNTTDMQNKVAGFNTDTLGVNSRNSGSDVTSATNNGDSTQDITEGVTDNTGHVHSSQIHGNIGVTTSQQMLQQEIDIAPKLNVVDYIVQSFKHRFCLMVY